MSFADDLSDDKLETTIRKNPERVFHVEYTSDLARGLKKVAVVKKWSPQKHLGAGSFGTVRLEKLEDDSGKSGRDSDLYRAVKILDKMQLARSKIDYKKELLALSKFSKPKVVIPTISGEVPLMLYTSFRQHQVFVEFLGWFEDEASIYLAMEFFPFGTLDAWINGVTLREPEAKLIARQLLEGLKIMHEEGFTHRDLKPQNIFVVHMAPVWWVKIGDFGISKRVSNDETALQTATGTPHYLAPEVRHYVRDKSMKPGVYTNAVDIWSFACVIYQILACQVPFPGGALDLIYFCEGGLFPEEPLVPSISEIGIDFLKFVMVPLPSLRPSAARALEEPWLRDGIVPDPSLSTQLDKLSMGKDELPNQNGGDTSFSLLEPFTYVSKTSSGLYTAELDANKKYDSGFGGVKPTTEISSHTSTASIIRNEGQLYPRPTVPPMAEAQHRPSQTKRRKPLGSDVAAPSKSQSNSKPPSTLIREIGHLSGLKAYSGADSVDAAKARAANSRRIAHSRELSHDVPSPTPKAKLGAKSSTHNLNVQVMKWAPGPINIFSPEFTYLFYARFLINDIEVKTKQREWSRAKNGQDWEVDFGPPEINKLGKVTKDDVFFVEIMQKSKHELQEDMSIGWTSFQLGEKIEFTFGERRNTLVRSGVTKMPVPPGSTSGLGDLGEIQFWFFRYT